MRLLMLCLASLSWGLFAFLQPNTKAALQLNSLSWNNFNWSNILSIFDFSSKFYRGSGVWTWDLIYIPSPFEQFPLLAILVCITIYILIRYSLSLMKHQWDIDLAVSSLAISFLLLIINIGRVSHSWYISGMYSIAAYSIVYIIYRSDPLIRIVRGSTILNNASILFFAIFFFFSFNITKDTLSTSTSQFCRLDKSGEVDFLKTITERL